MKNKRAKSPPNLSTNPFLEETTDININIMRPTRRVEQEHRGFSDDSLPPGVTAHEGSGLSRIRKHNPALWAKITNWD